MNRNLLEQPFPDNLLRSRKGPFGQTFTYVEGTEYIRRLNYAFEGSWSFEIVEHQVREAEVMVLGKLVADGVAKMAFGGSSITVSRDGEVISIADDLKAAATDALKKAASLFGVGLHLHGGDRTADLTSTGNGSARANGNGQGNGRANGNGRTHNGNGRVRATQKQVGAIWALSRRLGLSSDAVQTRCAADFGTKVEALSKSDASSLIEQLGAEVDGG
jgi:hypothetical protein